MFDSLSRGNVSDIIPWIDDLEQVLVDLGKNYSMVRSPSPALAPSFVLTEDPAFIIVEALISTNSADAITGLQVWCRRAFKDMTKQNGGRSRHSRSDKSTQRKYQHFLLFLMSMVGCMTNQIIPY